MSTSPKAPHQKHTHHHTVNHIEHPQILFIYLYRSFAWPVHSINRYNQHTNSIRILSPTPNSFLVCHCGNKEQQMVIQLSSPQMSAPNQLGPHLSPTISQNRKPASHQIDQSVCSSTQDEAKRKTIHHLVNIYIYT